MHRTGLTTLFLLWIAWTGGGRATAGEISIRWNGVPGAAGYRVHFGTSPDALSRVVDVGPSTEAHLTGLTDCRTWYTAVSAYDAAGRSGPRSGTLSGWPRPELGPRPTLRSRQGAQLTWSFQGANFLSGAELRVVADDLPRDEAGRPTVRLDALRVLDCHRAEALVTIEPLARGDRAMPIGDFEFEMLVVNPDSAFGEGVARLAVEFEPDRWDINRSYQETRERIDGADLAWLGYAYGQEQSDPRFLADADLDGNGWVDGADLALLAAGFGRCRDRVKGWSVQGCS